MLYITFLSYIYIQYNFQQMHLLLISLLRHISAVTTELDLVWSTTNMRQLVKILIPLTRCEVPHILTYIDISSILLCSFTLCDDWYDPKAESQNIAVSWDRFGQVLFYCGQLSCKLTLTDQSGTNNTVFVFRIFPNIIVEAYITTVF